MHVEFHVILNILERRDRIVDLPVHLVRQRVRATFLTQVDIHRRRFNNGGRSRFENLLYLVPQCREQAARSHIFRHSVHLRQHIVAPQTFGHSCQVKAKRTAVYGTAGHDCRA